MNASLEAEDPAHRAGGLRGLPDRPAGVRVLVLEFARSPSAGEANRRTAFAEVLGILTRMFEKARARAELREGWSRRSVQRCSSARWR